MNIVVEITNVLSDFVNKKKELVDLCEHCLKNEVWKKPSLSLKIRKRLSSLKF